MREVLVKNEEFKDSPLGKIPKDWEVKKLGELANNRGEYGSGAAALEFNSDLPRYVRITDITDDGNLDPNSRASINRPNAEGYYLQKGDLLFARSGATVGKTYLYDEADGECAHAGYVIKFSLDSSVCEPCFVSQWTRSSFYWTWVKQTLRQGAQPNINAEEYKSVNLPYPPVDEQRRIAEILDTVDEAKARTSFLITKLKQTKAGLLQNLLTRGLDEDGKLRDPQAHPEQFKDSALGRIPKEWEVRKMEEITTKIVDGVHKTPVYVESGIPFLTVENLTAGTGISLKNVRYVAPLDHAEFSKRADPESGDVLVTKDGTLGIARIVPDDLPEFSIFVSVAQLRPNETLVLPSFICTFFDTGEYEQQLGYRSAGTGLKHIHLEHFRAFLLAVPPIPEQSRIATIIDTHDNRIRTEETYLNKLKLQKQGLMQDLLTGKVRVKNIK